MTKVQEVQNTIQQFSPEEFNELMAWMEEKRARAWDEQIARDAQAGKLDALAKRAKEHVKAGQVHIVKPGSSLVP